MMNNYLKIFFCILAFSSAGIFSILHAQSATSPDKYELVGVYDTLYIDADTFKNTNHQKLVFQYFLNDGKFSLHGWSAKGVWGRKFIDSPSLRLSNGNPGKIKYAENKYFGDIVIDPRQIRSIKKYIIDSTTFVLFAPTLIDGVMNYVIMVTKDPNWPNLPGPVAPASALARRGSASTLAYDAPAPTDVIANPSPPRNFKKI